MNSDLLDDLLEESAPRARTIEPRDVRAMMADAAAESRPPRKRRRQVAVGGALALAFVGGAGVATANDLFPWSAEQQDPYVSVEYRLPSGLECEQRLLILDTMNQDAANWLRSFADENDLMALADVDGYLERMKAWGDTSTGDAAYWSAVSGAIWETVLTEADAAGFGSGVFTGEQSQTYCLDDDENVVFPR